MSYVNQALKPRHHLILQYAFNGLTNVAIAEKTGMSKVAISCILRSPAARAELARMTSLAVDKSTNIPARVALHNELTGAAIESVKISRALNRDPLTRPETRVKISQHFMDRVIFDKRNDGDEDKMSYRDILRKLDKIEAKVTTEPVELQRIDTTLESESLPTVDDTVNNIVNELNGHSPELTLVRGGVTKRIIDVSDPD